MKKNLFPPSITNLLLAEGQRFEKNGSFVEALGTGIIPIVGTARSGKTSLAYVMLDYVVRYTKRPIILESFPEKVLLEGIPDHWKGRVYNTPFSEIASIEEPAVWLVDDTSAHFNSRSAMEGNSKLLAKTAGVLSHFAGGMTVIFTTQLLSGVDVSFFRYTNISPVVRYVDKDLIAHERPEWKHTVQEGNYQLSRISNVPYYRDFYYSVKDDLLARSLFPEWLDKKVDPIKADLLSRPMRYHTQEMKESIIGKKKDKKRRKVVTDESTKE